MPFRALAPLALLVLVAGCSSGLRTQRELTALYQDDGGSSLSHRATVPRETFASRTLGRVPQLFGVAPTYYDAAVNDPGTFSRERMRALAARFPGRPGLLSQSLPLIARIAVAAPFDQIGRAHV